VDGGFQATGDSVVAHIRKYYGDPKHIHHVVATHPDGDHAGGLRKVLEEFEVGALWMLRPWQYAGELLDRFTRYTSVENLKKRLKEAYPNLAALEVIALRRGIPIYEPFQGVSIGSFIVMAPTRARFLDLVVESEKTPESANETRASVGESLLEGVQKTVARVVNFIRGAWGEEIFSTQSTSAENEIQFARLNERTILLTADAGRVALAEAADFAPSVALELPGIDRFQVPHHGSRRNVSTEVLDRWLGKRAAERPTSTSFTALISSAKADEDHPRKAVVRAMIHRGAQVVATEGQTIRTSQNAPDRDGWVPSTPMNYPDEQEDE
jgi:hypothetical protein